MSTAKKAATTLLQRLRSHIKAPWEITGPCASPEYKHAIPKATEYRPFCPVTEPIPAIIPTSDPENVYDIKYFPRDQSRNRPPIRRTILKKADVLRMKAEKTKFDLGDFPRPYLVKAVEEDDNGSNSGYTG